MKVTGTFRLPGSVIEPGSESIAIQLAGPVLAYNAQIPAGAALAKSHGWKFKGSAPGGGQMNVALTTKDGVAFKQIARANTFTAGGSITPLGTVTFRVGNDCFAATLPCLTKGSGREVCRPAR
jgi:hypothetical protein